MNTATANSTFDQPEEGDIHHHRTVTTEHEIEVDGCAMVEKKVKTTVTNEDDKVVKVILRHLRRIDDHSYAVYEVTDGADVVTDHQVFTELTEVEVEEFKKKWDEFWCPTVSNDNLEDITKNLPYETETVVPSKDTVPSSNIPPEGGRPGRISSVRDSAVTWNSRAPGDVPGDVKRTIWDSSKSPVSRDSGVSMAPSSETTLVAIDSGESKDMSPAGSRVTWGGKRPDNPDYDEIKRDFKKTEASRRNSV